MPKIKIPKKSPSLDMTPMVDLAFLLVTFFMLTTKFRPDEPVVVDQPSSVSEIPLPDQGVIMLTVDKNGRVFFNVEGQQVRRDILERLGKRFNIEFSEEEKKKFSLLSSVGVPSNNLKEYLSATDDQRKAMNLATPGIPTDSLNNELSVWVNAARNAAPRNSIAINGDRDADIPTIKRVIATLQDNKANRFALITNLESE
ncbi:MAG: biopolymer transporter ExbD [Bacteroidetes bacterium]|nr:MAG: biopolymer transporter ExbD [Bacteroidota bacterium]REK00758.1 MAG: biopolymer transporter ExbD [Bacteroidota bacterium]REK35006.1 MAG: biopolymer transporter ExbD [Bacteroidota bacterium]REK48196.1 MAG: biopolymer transporter ExbD [Bacteroidota bacterium]